MQILLNAPAFKPLKPRFASGQAGLTPSQVGLLKTFAGNVYHIDQGPIAVDVVDWLATVKTGLNADHPQGAKQEDMLNYFMNEGSKKRGINIIPALLAQGFLTQLPNGNLQLSPTILPHLTDDGLKNFKTQNP